MTRIPFLVLAAAIAIPCALGAQERPATLADPGPDRHLIYGPAEIEWRDGPGSLPPGATFVVLEGNPAEGGVFTLRIRMPDGYVIPPHWHAGVERVTVLAGTFHVGHGETLDRAAAQPLGEGSYFSFPPGMRHYAITEGETVVQLTSVGPWVITYVNADDDPRDRER